jgi:hypothetical protein
MQNALLDLGNENVSNQYVVEYSLHQVESACNHCYVGYGAIARVQAVRPDHRVHIGTVVDHDECCSKHKLNLIYDW